jgi:signal peptidase I
VATTIIWSWPLAAYILDGNRVLKTYYIPSESMRPTLEPGDRIIPRALAPGVLKRGVLALYRLRSGEVRATRVAAEGGDRIAVSQGVVYLNGAPVAQRPAGAGPNTATGEPTRRLIEQFPGEATPHAILDTGMSPQDEFGEITVPRGYLFVLGDNRDNSADSRFPADQFGAGLISVDNVMGTVDFIAWSTGRHRVARAIDDLKP